MKVLTKHEEILLISIFKLKEEAYGAGLKRYIYELTGKDWNYGNLYCTLDQLVKKNIFQKAPAIRRLKEGGEVRIFTV